MTSHFEMLLGIAICFGGLIIPIVYLVSGSVGIELKKSLRRVFIVQLTGTIAIMAGTQVLRLLGYVDFMHLTFLLPVLNLISIVVYVLMITRTNKTEGA